MNRFLGLAPRARILVLGVWTAGVGATAVAWIARPPEMKPQTLLLMGLAVVGGLVRVPLPVVGRLSFAYPFMFGCLMAFGLGASCLAGILSAAASSLLPVQGRRQPMHRALFNVGLVGLAASASGAVYLFLGGPVGPIDLTRDVWAILVYTLCFSSLNLGLLSLMIRLSGEVGGVKSLRANFAWSIPGFLAGSSLATLLGLLLEHENLSLLLLGAPFAYLIDLAYRARTERAEELQSHSQQTAELYQSVTRALALAIEAKDENTEDHLQRVQQLCLGIAERLNLPQPEMEALRAAALLHDIGKIAVPEYILTKPGRLTPDEMEKMRIHPGVGAEILSVVPFPYPLAAIVRHHHERWDGTGYPDRLAGTDIPLAARILTLVDSYDALTTDRPYRKAVSRREAIQYLRREARTIFDPKLVEIFADHVDQLERRIRSLSPAVAGRLETEELDPRLEREPVEQRKPLIEREGIVREAEESLSSGRAMQVLHDLARTVAHQLDLDETLTLLAAKLFRLVPHRSLVVYLFDHDQQRLITRFSTGLAADKLKGLIIPVGERLSGWAALHQRAYIGRAHVNPVERDGSRSDLEDLTSDAEIAELRSALVAPLSTEHEQLGVLAVYHGPTHSYTQEDRRLLLAAAAHFTQALRNALLFERNSSDSLTDPLTGLPNWRFYFLEAGQRFSRDEEGQDVGVLAFRLQGLHQVRELYGASACDRLLGEVARRLARESGTGETLVRMGGDLFLVLAAEGRPRALAARCLDFLRSTQAEPAQLHPQVFQRVRLQAAHAVFPEDGRDPDRLLHVVKVRLETCGLNGYAYMPFPTGRWSSLAGLNS